MKPWRERRDSEDPGEGLPSDTYLLVGMLDSPFVRRVAVTLLEYDVPFRNLPLRTFGDAAEFAVYSPLKRAPTLVLPSGERLYDSPLILDYLDELADGSATLLPSGAAERLLCRQVSGVAAGLADKAVAALYEKVFHPEGQRSALLLARLAGQLTDSQKWLEERAPDQGLLFGPQLSHADIMVGAALCFAHEVHPDLVRMEQTPGLAAWCERIDSHPSFQQTYLAVEPPQI